MKLYAKRGTTQSNENELSVGAGVGVWVFAFCFSYFFWIDPHTQYIKKKKKKKKRRRIVRGFERPYCHCPSVVFFRWTIRSPVWGWLVGEGG